MTWLIVNSVDRDSVKQISSLVRGRRKDGVGMRVLASMEVGVKQGLSLKKVVGSD